MYEVSTEVAAKPKLEAKADDFGQACGLAALIAISQLKTAYVVNAKRNGVVWVFNP